MYRRNLPHIENIEKTYFVAFHCKGDLELPPSAHNINKRLNRRGPVWQDESFDHLLRSEGDFAEKMMYIIENPVKAGLVSNPKDYKWLSRSS